MYGQTNPEYIGYLYLVAPISLAILNPIAFIMMEYGTRYEALQAARTRTRTVTGTTPTAKVPWLQVAKGVISNPLISMVILGTILNFILGGQLPTFITMILEALYTTYIGLALFTLGMSMVGRFSTFTARKMLAPLLLTIAKSVILPIIILFLVIGMGGSSSLALFGFLFGTIPTSPMVFLFATTYKVGLEETPTAMILCTLLAAPLIFISVRMASLSLASVAQPILDTAIYIGYLGMAGALLVLIGSIAAFSRRPRRVDAILISLFVVQLALPIAGTTCYASLAGLSDKIRWASLFVFRMSGFLWAALLTLYWSMASGAQFKRRLTLPLILLAIGWCVPAILAISIVVLANYDVSTLCWERFGTPEYIVETVVLCILLAGVIFGLLRLWRAVGRASAKTALSPRVRELDFRYQRLSDSGQGPKPSLAGDEPVKPSGEACPAPSSTVPLMGSDDGDNAISCQPTGPSTEPLDTVADSAAGGSHIELGTLPSEATVKADTAGRSAARNDVSRSERHQHLLLIMYLAFTMLMVIVRNITVFSNSSGTGLAVELEFLSAVLIYGQGVASWLLLGLRERYMLPFSRIQRAVVHWFREHVLHQEQVWVYDDLELSLVDSIAYEQCYVFRTQHLKHARDELPSDRRVFLTRYENVFSGTDLVDWLLINGLCQTRAEAVDYGRSLIMGRVIYHVDFAHDFADQSGYYYRFADPDQPVITDEADAMITEDLTELRLMATANQ